MKTVADLLREKAERDSQGNWFPANGGTETAFITRNRFRLLYCYQPSTGRHAYLNCDTDIILSDEEARLALGV
jgi:hypothetical protein